jgi:hypothetical protein
MNKSKYVGVGNDGMAGMYLTYPSPTLTFPEKEYLTNQHIVFKSPVKSGFLTPKGATVDRNRSKPLPLLGGPQPNRIGPVLFGSVAPQRPVGTGPTLVPTTFMIKSRQLPGQSFESGQGKL